MEQLRRLATKHTNVEKREPARLLRARPTSIPRFTPTFSRRDTRPARGSIPPAPFCTSRRARDEGALVRSNVNGAPLASRGGASYSRRRPASGPNTVATFCSGMTPASDISRIALIGQPMPHIGSKPSIIRSCREKSYRVVTYPIL